MFETRSFDLCPIFWTKDYGHVGRVECLNARFVPLLVAALLKLVKLLRHPSLAVHPSALQAWN